MKCSRLISALVFLAVFAAAVSCSTSSKLSRIRKSDLRIGLALPSEEDLETYAGIVPERGDRRDTLVIKDLEGREVYIMSAVQDEITGEMVATEQLAAAVVTARFRNVAERNGKVHLEFQVTVPSDLQDSRWQLRFHPRLFFLRAGCGRRAEPAVCHAAHHPAGYPAGSAFCRCGRSRGPGAL